MKLSKLKDNIVDYLGIRKEPEPPQFWHHELWDDRWNDTMMEVLKVVELGARKHGAGSWANLDNPSIEHKACCASLFRHLASEQVNQGSIDKESGVRHIAHLLCRGLMKATHNSINRGEL